MWSFIVGFKKYLLFSNVKITTSAVRNALRFVLSSKLTVSLFNLFLDCIDVSIREMG